MGDNNDRTAGIFCDADQVIERRSCFVSGIQRAIVADIGAERIEDQQLCSRLYDSRPDTVVAEGQILFILADKKELVPVAVRSNKTRYDSIVRIIFCRLVNNRHRLMSIFFIRKRQRPPFGNERRHRQHQLTFAVTGITLQQRNLAEWDVGIPQPFHLLWRDVARLDELQF